MSVAERLYPLSSAPKTKTSSLKYKLSCQERVEDPSQDTRDWLELIEQLDHDSHNIKIFQALLETRKHVIVKVSLSKNEEYEKGKILSLLKLPTLLIFFCEFKCLDTFDKIKIKHRLCENGIDQINLLVMPFIKLGRIDKFKWTRENIHVYKSLLKHIVCTLLHAFETCQFTHNDMHFGNLLLKKTKKREIQYGDRKTLPIVNGYMPVIMDYERSDFTTTDTTLLFRDIGNLFNLAGTEIDVQLNISKLFVGKYKSVSQKVYDELCDHIDSRQVTFVVSEISLKRIV